MAGHNSSTASYLFMGVRPMAALLVLASSGLLFEDRKREWRGFVLGTAVGKGGGSIAPRCAGPAIDIRISREVLVVFFMVEAGMGIAERPEA
jgi:hypothetical protein